MRQELKSVTLHTMSFGEIQFKKFQLECKSNELHQGVILIIEGFGEIKIQSMINGDTRRFEHLNRMEDEHHQIDMSTLKMIGIEIIEAPTPLIRLKYAFKQDKDFWRSVSGETGELHMSSSEMCQYESGKKRWYASEIYTKGACVYW